MNMKRRNTMPRGGFESSSERDNPREDRSRSPFRPYQAATQVDAPSGEQHYEYYSEQQSPGYEVRPSRAFDKRQQHHETPSAPPPVFESPYLPSSPLVRREQAHGQEEVTSEH